MGWRDNFLNTCKKKIIFNILEKHIYRRNIPRNASWLLSSNHLARLIINNSKYSKLTTPISAFESIKTRIFTSAKWTLQDIIYTCFNVHKRSKGFCGACSFIPREFNQKRISDAMNSHKLRTRIFWHFLSEKIESANVKAKCSLSWF